MELLLLENNATEEEEPTSKLLLLPESIISSELELKTEEELLLGSIISPFCELLELLPLPSSPDEQEEVNAKASEKPTASEMSLNLLIKYSYFEGKTV
jgi:hypothetical protein